jgi:hypothetical protein
VTEVSNESPLNKQDKSMGLESSKHATRTGASTGCHIPDYKSCPEKEHKELNVEEAAPIEESPKRETRMGLQLLLKSTLRRIKYQKTLQKLRAHNSLVVAQRVSMNNAFSRFRLEDNLLLGNFINTQYSFEGFGIDGMAPGVQIHENQYASKMATRYVMPFCLVSSLVYSLFQHFYLSNRCHIYIYIHHHIRILIFLPGVM